MTTATGSINNLQCSIAENEKDSKDSHEQLEPSSKFPELPKNMFGNREGTSLNGRQTGIIGGDGCCVEALKMSTNLY